MTTFEHFDLSDALHKSLARMNYSTPTPIQEKAIPLALQGRDVLGSAQTGTGKTAAFSIPVVESVMRDTNNAALILTPTRELAKQVLEVIHQLIGRDSDINTAFIIGGEPMPKQFNQLRRNPRIIVGTPGRINDHLNRGSIDLETTNFLVLDETDRMLDMGFGIQLDSIVEHLPEERQTLMFSATLPDGIVRISKKYLDNPERVSVGATNTVAVKIKQEVIRIEQDQKYKELLTQLHEREGSVIVFSKTKHAADRMAKNLRRDGFTADALHGDLRQRKRDTVMRNFRDKNFRVLVATDIAARGLDVPHIEHVINYDLPQVAEDYIHRMGRTARAGAEGAAISFVSNQDGRKWSAIERLLDPDGSKKENAKKGKGPRRNTSKKIDGKKQRHKSMKNKKGGTPRKGAPKNHEEHTSQDRHSDAPKNEHVKKARPHKDGKPEHKKRKPKSEYKGDKPQGEKPERRSEGQAAGQPERKFKKYKPKTSGEQKYSKGPSDKAGFKKRKPGGGVKSENQKPRGRRR